MKIIFPIQPICFSVPTFVAHLNEKDTPQSLSVPIPYGKYQVILWGGSAGVTHLIRLGSPPGGLK